MLLIKDTNLVRNVLIRDFHHFADRGIYYDEKNDPLSAHLFALDKEKWKNLRQKISPAFTPGTLASNTVF